MLLQIAVIALGLCVVPGYSIVSDRVYQNCELLGDNRRLELQWTVNRTTSTIDFQLCGCDVGADAPNEYMAFGLSADPDRTLMRGADATVAWVDTNNGPMAVDYFLSAYQPCLPEMGGGACPDTMDPSGSCTDDISAISGFKREGFQCVAFTRSFSTSDDTCDISFDVDSAQRIVWAVGGIADTAFRHSVQAPMDEAPITLGRQPLSQCQAGISCPNCAPFVEKVINATGRDETFVAHIGPPANPRGYTSIADQVGWGISWYINDTLIPRIIVERGYTYTFVAYGGMDSEAGNNYHPFYLTDSRRGGRFNLSPSRREKEEVFAGFDENGDPLGIGAYCDFTESAQSAEILNTCGPEADYFAGLNQPNCPDDEQPGSFTWTPDEDTPNSLYYQCATHLNLGYQIVVMPQLDFTQAPTIAGAQGLLAYTTTIVLMLALAAASVF